jgi:UDP:flavonoid glycosyltransferase YjiC (YdhE family)
LVRPFLPQVALVRHAAVAITHGGNGGVTEALTHGVPVLALPFSTDQFAIAADLERTGVGRAADPNQVTDAEVRDAVLDLLGDPFRGAALDLGQQLRADPGPARAWRAVTAMSGMSGMPAVPAAPAVTAGS